MLWCNMKILVAYDICSPSRLRRVAKIAQDYGQRVQRSVFEMDIGKKQLVCLQRRIERVLSLEEDGVKYYPLCEKCSSKIEVFGQGSLVRQCPPYEVI